MTLLPDWPRAWGKPPVTAVLRASAADFVVEEILGFEPGGAGEHCWLWVEKENLNTADAATRLARFAGLRERDVSYSGLKDRQAIARQWFSLHLLNREVDWTRWNDPSLRLLRIVRHHRKLRRGTHRGNRFDIVLRDVRGDADAFADRLQQVGEQGVPNYFGEQRFGRDGRNVEAAQRWIASGRRRLKPHQEGLHLSTLRSYLFNLVLAHRVHEGSWCTPLPGEVFMLDGSASVFREAADEVLQARIARGDVHLTGPLPGRASGLAPELAVAELEQRCLEGHQALVAALADAGVDAARRSLRLRPADWSWAQFGERDWRLRFELPSGCFATSVVRELARLNSVDSQSGASE